MRAHRTYKDGDLRIDCLAIGDSREMVITHLPTGTYVKGSGHSTYRLQLRLLDELQQKLRMKEDAPR